MKKLISFFLIVYVVIFSCYAQNNILFQEIQQAKESNIYFENVFFETTSVDMIILENFINRNEVFFFNSISLDVSSNEIKAMNLTIPLYDKNLILELLEVPNYYYDYRIVTQNGEWYNPNRNIKHYRGVVRNEGNSLVAITFFENEIMGLVFTDEGNFNIVKDKQSGKHIFYSDKNMLKKPDFICSTDDVLPEPYDIELLNDTVSDRSNTVINKIVRFYVETDYSIYLNKGSIQNVEAYITGLMNQVSVLYYKEAILTNISTIYIWTSTDPYINMNTTTELLDKFQEIRTSITGDLGMLFTFRSVGGGKAVLDGLCRSLTKNKLGVAGLYSYYNLVPEYSWSVYVVTHELGHLFGSSHTHACVWNGNNTAIDGCGITAGYPEGKCQNPGHPQEGGTIMSYCHLFWDVWINFILGFGPQPGNVIRDKVSKARCLDECVTSFVNQTVSSNKTIRGCDILNIQGVTITNSASVSIQAFEKVIIESGFVANAGTKVNIDIDFYIPIFLPKKSNMLLSDAETIQNFYSKDDLSDISVLSINENITPISSFSAVPNPNPGSFQLETNFPLSDIYTLKITNLLGITVYEAQTLSSNTIHLPVFTSGLHFVVVTLKDGSFITQKIMVQR